MRRLAACAFAAALAGCGGDSGTGPEDQNPEPPPPAPAEVVIVTGQVENPREFLQLVTLVLRNDGGAGVFKVQGWGYPTSPGGGDTFMGDRAGRGGGGLSRNREL